MILFVDDERRRMESYYQELRLSGYEVEFKSDVDSALKYLKCNPSNLGLIILDIMMPIGNMLNPNEAENGLRTGVCLLNRINEIMPLIPIMIFTNANIFDSPLIEEYKENNLIKLCSKGDYLPNEFVYEIERFLGN